MFKKIFSNKTFQSWLWLFVVLSVWETASQLRLIPHYFLPPFSRVVTSMFQQIFSGNLGIQAFNSLFIIVAGLILSVLLSIIIILLCSWFKPVETLFLMLVTIFNPLPAVALIPLIILWFGINTSAMLIIIIHAVLWALIRHLLDGLRSIPKVYYEWSDNIELSPVKKFTDVLLHAILPGLISGIRVGWGRAWRALIGAEMVFGMIGTLGGIGYYIYTARAFANTTNVMAGVVVIIIIGVIVESVLFNQIEKHTIVKWGMIRE